MIPKPLTRSKTANATAWHEAGTGEPFLLLHGVGLRFESWFPQIPALAEKHQIFAIDLPGHGDSAKLAVENPAIADYTDHIAGFVREIIGRPAMIAGHSLGALIALDLAVRYPDLCKGIAALTPVFERPAEASKAVRQRAASIRDNPACDLSAGAVTRWFGEAPRDRYAEMASLCRSWLEANDRAGYVAAYTAFASSDGPDPSAVAALDMPSLFLTGEFDPNSTPSMSKALAAFAPGGEVAVIGDARHMVQLTHPGEVNEALLRFGTRCAEREK